MEPTKMLTVGEFVKRNPEFKKSDLDTLRDWLKKQPHLPQMPDYELALFLHSNYYRVEPTKTSIDAYFTVRTHVPEFFTARDPLGSKELRLAMKVACHIPLPGTTPDGYRVLFVKLLDFNPSHYIQSDALRLFCMTLELWQYTASNGTGPGQVMVFDMDGVEFGHLARLSPILMKKFLYYLQEALPIRLKGIHVINTRPLADLLLNIVKSFIRKELMDLISFHTNLETLSKHVPIDLLPNEQGGKAGPVNDLWAAEIKRTDEHRPWFQNEETRKANEAARLGKEKNFTEIFGVEGSFKMLDID